MAADIWTLNLQCEGAPHGQQYVQRKMAKDEICFFNLVALIEDYGYTSIDYIYYKSRERLVFIQLDTDVMKMLRDNESKKEVNLLVTSQCIATMAGTKSNKAPTSAENRTKGKRGTKKKQQLNVIETKAQYATDEVNQQHDDDIPETPVAKRSGTVLTHVWGLPEEKRILVKCNQLGQPIGKEGGLLGQFLGTIARNGGYCPIHLKDWRLVKKDSARTILECIQTKFLYPRSCEKWILKSIGRDWRKYKSTLKKKLFSPKKKRSALYKLCPDDIDEDQWKALVKYWKSTEGKAASEKNTLSFEMRKTPHTGGTKSFARWSEDMVSIFYYSIYFYTFSLIRHVLVQLENLVEKQPELAENIEGRVAWEGDALHQVLGEEKPGQVHGMGLLPIPKQVYGRTTRQLKDINIATIDGSSADVETHMFEEIQQLKDRVRKQDRVIDELVNKKRDHENEEPNKIDQANIQNHVLQSNRKRIQCPEPNHGDAAYQQRDESNNRTCESDDNDDPVLSNKKCQGDANLNQLSLREGEPSSPQCSTNDFTQKQDGTTVLLKTASRQNSLVAYATIVSSRPKATVGGVEIGKQFYKVRINHPILQNEPLIRPMADCSKIGDAHAKGTLIAWPSTCVEMING
ncbi:unnamed protein product [Urochloa decumbens]|uniref:Transposase Tnp1/En/Spm-like domain-containing protein n=1 Tax=Urochloa decumbens TaxID=240449 RepID=A0ABC9CEN0_9POAL